MALFKSKVFYAAIVFYIVFLISFSTFCKGWEQDEFDEWHYVEDDGTYAKDKIVLSGASKFYFNSEGNMEKNFFLQDYKGHSYYFVANGVMLTNFSVYIKTTTKSNKKIIKSQSIYFDERGRAAKLGDEYLSVSLETYMARKDQIANYRDRYLYKKNGDTFSFGRYSVTYSDGFNRVEELNWKVLDISDSYVVACCLIPLYDEKSDRKIICDDADVNYWLNNSFFESAFNEYEKELIKGNVLNPDGVFVVNNSEYSFLDTNQALIGINLSSR